MKRRKLVLQLGLLLVMLLLAVGCQNNENNDTINESKEHNNNGEAPASSEEDFSDESITLTWFNWAAGINNEDDLNDLVVVPVQQRYPNLMFEYHGGDLETLEELLISGNIPDV